MKIAASIDKVLKEPFICYINIRRHKKGWLITNTKELYTRGKSLLTIAHSSHNISDIQFCDVRYKFDKRQAQKTPLVYM